MSEEFDVLVTELSGEKKRLMKQRLHEAIRCSVDENLRKMRESLAADDAGMACSSAAELVNMVGDSYIYGMSFREIHDKVRGALDDLAPGGINPMARKAMVWVAGGDPVEPSDEKLLTIKTRIEASRAEHEERLNELGKLTGRWWVTHSAKFDQLERLSESANGYYPEEIDELNELLFPSNHQSPLEMVEFWNRVSRENTVLSADIEDPLFVQGFFEGSLELYEEAMAA